MGDDVELGQVGDRYRSSRERLTALLRTIGPDPWDLPVEACPGWRVRDVLGHLLGNVEDALAGRLSGPPGPEQTAEQVERHRTDDPRALLDQWSATAPDFEGALTAFEIWPAFIDVLSHEHDVRTALGDRSCRDHDDVAAAATLLRGAVALPSDLSDFEVLRLRLGRRSVAQVQSLLGPSGASSPIEELFVFGTRDTDLEE